MVVCSCVVISFSKDHNYFLRARIGEFKVLYLAHLKCYNKLDVILLQVTFYQEIRNFPGIREYCAIFQMKVREYKIFSLTIPISKHFLNRTVIARYKYYKSPFNSAYQ